MSIDIFAWALDGAWNELSTLIGHDWELFYNKYSTFFP